MINKLFHRYGHWMKMALAQGDEAGLLELALRSAGLIEKARHDLEQFARLGKQGGLGKYKKAISRAGMLATVQERELALFALFFSPGNRRTARRAAENNSSHRSRIFFRRSFELMRSPSSPSF